ncbi:MAG: UDP-glucose 4-epimerase GalE [Methylibium sp.]|uniref:UDP-glucose 4-epimerase GalE n=1 Tax=Methylibium sp. TaxID=2067992 RepID=UPI0017A0AB31|nr:UDP-glucose 4-epimerase GalE [Methylibium sp.]MBA3597001.1 UDP-glucose 4-epimerase GalE [Methylibium sp.]
MILVTGGTGFIGSHTCVALAAAGKQFLILDNLRNSRRSVLGGIEALVGRPVPFVEGDIRDATLLDRLFAEHDIEAVIHFAALKAVGESVQQPLAYYENNVSGTIGLVEAMQRAKVHSLVFSSSATVYGDPATVPIREDFPLSATNPYGWSKLMTEQILADLSHAEPQWRIARLRYFNPVGAHESGLIGEDPSGLPNNLMPFVAQVAAGQRGQLQVFGGDYPTADGTGVRDYIHVMDLAEGHVAALDCLAREPGLLTVNLGTGHGVSVLEMVAAFEQASGRAVPYRIVARRPGDVAACWADPTLAQQRLGWTTRRDLAAMCADAWRWQSGRAGESR